MEEYKGLIRFLEIETGKQFNHSEFLKQMHRINAQQAFFEKARKLIAETRPCPVGITDQIPNTMIPQWHRGSEWATTQAEKFYLAVKNV